MSQETRFDEPDTLVEEPRYVRVLHPVTGKFLFELDTDRMVVVAFDRGIEGTIDLARTRSQPNKDKRRK